MVSSLTGPSLASGPSLSQSPRVNLPTTQIAPLPLYLPDPAPIVTPPPAIPVVDFATTGVSIAMSTVLSLKGTEHLSLHIEETSASSALAII